MECTGTVQDELNVNDQPLAAAHQSWSGWSYTIPVSLIDRWQRQMNTPHDDFSDQEQASDDVKVESVLNRMQRWILLNT